MNESMMRQWLEMIVDSDPSAVIVLDKDRRIVFANNAAAALARVERKEQLRDVSYDAIVAQSKIYDEEGREPSPKDFPSTVALMQGIEVKNVVFEQVHKGEHAWLSVSATPIFDEKGEPQYAVVRFRDLSLRKKREGQLHVMLESVKVLSLTVDFETRLREKARIIVPALADWCTINALRGDGRLERVAVVHRDPAKRDLVVRLAEISDMEMGENGPIRAVLVTGKPVYVPDVAEQFMRSQMHISNERRELMEKLGVVSSITIPIISHGEVLGALSVAQAESQRHFTPDDLEFLQEFCFHIGVLLDNARLYEEIRTRDKAKDSFLAALSHELRNPLAPIKASLELLRIKNSSPDIESEIGVLEGQFEHLTKLLNDLLDVTRYTQGRIHLEKQPFDLGELIEAIARTYRPLLAKHNISLLAQVPKSAVLFSGDRVRIEQAIMNILHNAQKFTPPGGTIRIEMRIDGKRAAIFVRDSGVGMEPSDLKRIFELHFQGNNKLRGENAGLGIGLVLVQEIVRRHGGKVEAASEGPGRGSEFIVTLPLLEPALEGAAQ